MEARDHRLRPRCLLPHFLYTTDYIVLRESTSVSPISTQSSKLSIETLAQDTNSVTQTKVPYTLVNQTSRCKFEAATS